MKTPVTLTLAGSDPTGGAGVQADLKAFAAHGVYGVSVITSVTAQNTARFLRAYDLPPSIIEAQLKAVFQDFSIRAVKIGMISNSKIMGVIHDFLKKKKIKNLVIDPVLHSKTGGSLLAAEAVKALKTKLLPHAVLVTPNVGEAEKLSGLKIRTPKDMEKAAEQISAFGVRYVLIKGGDDSFSRATDLLYNGKIFHWIKGKFIPGKKPHGTGCAYAAAITAGLAKAQSVEKSIEAAKGYIEKAIRDSTRLGKGHELLKH